MPEATGAERESCAGFGKPAEAHKRFEPFVGSFRASVQMWMGPGEPMVSTGVMTNTLELGGRYLRHSYRGDPSPGPFPAFEGHGYWGYNTVDERYEGFWIDNACTLMQWEHGQVDRSGRVWTMLSTITNPQTGEPMEKKSVIRLEGENRHTMEMFAATADGQWQKSMHIEYTRQ